MALKKSETIGLAPDLTKTLMEYRASIKDSDTRNELLKELVLKYARTERELSRLNRELNEKQARIEEDLKAAAAIQKSLLPKELPVFEEMSFGWKFVPSQMVGGDVFNIFRLDEDHFACFIIDVSGHGVPAAMITVSVSQMLLSNTGSLIKRRVAHPPYYEVASPGEVLSTLDREYPIERFDKYFTMVYMLLDRARRTIRYSNAGHPSPVLIRRDKSLKLLESGGSIIGLNESMPFEEEEISLEKGEKLFLYTDGVTDHCKEDGEPYGEGRFISFLKRHADRSVNEILEALYEDIRSFGSGSEIQDDFTLLAFECNPKQDN